MFKNRLINGAMNIFQRATGATVTAASAYTTADRWCGALGTTNLTLTQSATVPANTGFQNSLQVATSTTTTGVPLIEQRIEYVNVTDLFSGVTVSVSFWASQTAGTLMPLTVGLYYATAVNNFGTQTLAVVATQNTPTLTATLVNYTLTFVLTTSLGATQGLCLRFTTGSASAAGSTFLITGIQLEKGPSASPFEYRMYPAELALAQRYYYQMTNSSAYSAFGNMGVGVSTTNTWFSFSFPVSMHPTSVYSLSNSAVGTFQFIGAAGTGITVTTISGQTDSMAPNGAFIQIGAGAATITAGQGYVMRANNQAAGAAYIGFSAEL
jgi:hypothetical protein